MPRWNARAPWWTPRSNLRLDLELCAGFTSPQTVIKESWGVFKAKGGLASWCDPEKCTHVTTGTVRGENVGGTTNAFHLCSRLTLRIIYLNKAVQTYSLFLNIDTSATASPKCHASSIQNHVINAKISHDWAAVFQSSVSENFTPYWINPFLKESGDCGAVLASFCRHFCYIGNSFF